MRQLIRTTTIAVAAVAAPSTSVAVAEGLDVTIGGWAEGSAVLPDGDVAPAGRGPGALQRDLDAVGDEVEVVPPCISIGSWAKCVSTKTGPW
ncbi:hypothetical protein SAMN06296429_106115 [Janibacter indicus]|uniref:Uncharacterized protein n=1 Tax=Janibacter indicus TaxID=857417 RepID=A0A1W2APN2_9MICO|nr:hypothetical protein SAMN06296429_106115 [Janibacter indicus]